MKGFLRFYRWGMDVKLYMSIYTVALIFFRGIVALAQGESSVNVWIMLEMLLVSFLFAGIQSALFPTERTLEPQEKRRRSVLWAVLGNVLFLGGALLFGWFPGVPLWAAALLIVALEAALFAMWFGDHVARQKDTKTLNDRLRDYQQGR